MLNLAVLGYGTVGSGVVEVFFKNRESMQKKAGQQLGLKYILDIRDFPDSPWSDLMTKDFTVILEDPTIKVVAEVMGGTEPAYTFTKACLESGKSVVTSNKELVANKGAELLEIAREHHVNYFFEASVGGGIPIIRPLHMCLAANSIQEIAGILNGTTNFILTKMIRENMSFDSALALAQKLGYAERDPAADVLGHDACRKICILASLSFGEQILPADVPTQGITDITLEDVAYAQECGCVIKLIGRAARAGDGRVCAMVAPALIRHDSQLGTVEDVFNAILVRADATGDVVFYGKGAGKLPTASAVLADVVDCAKASGNNPSLSWKKSSGANVTPRGENITSLYVRCRGEGALEKAKSCFDDLRVLHRPGQPDGEYAFITPTTTENELDAALDRIARQDVKILQKIRILDY